MTARAWWTVGIIFAATAVVPGPRPVPAVGEKPLATVQLSPGWATFGQVLPGGAARSDVQVGTLETQSDVKTRWPDGSIRFAVVTAHVTAPGARSLWPAPARVGRFEPEVPAVSVAFRTGGAMWAARSSAQVSTDRWLSGPLVTEWRDTVAPARPDGNQHPWLRVVFDTRIYRDGQGQVDLTVENVLNTRGAAAITYDVEVVLDGRPIFARMNVTHHYLTRWRKVFPMRLTVSTVTPDFEPAFKARAVPRYLSFVTEGKYSTDGSRFDILGGGNFHNPMNDHGGRSEIAPYPDWVARYLIHARNTSGPATRAYMLAMDEQAAAWPVHIRERDQTLVSIDAKPSFWLDGRCGRAGGPAGLVTCPEGDLTATGPLRPEGNNHQPSIGYVSYLVTGDRFFAEEMAFWANYSLLWTFEDSHYNARGGGHAKGPGTNTPVHPGSWGLLTPNEVRGIGWGLRVLVDAATYLPDQDPLKANFSEKVQHNLDALDARADADAALYPLGFSFAGHRPEGRQRTPPTAYIADWEQQYVAWAVDHAARQGFSGGTRLRDRVARWSIKLYTSGPEFPQAYSVPYVLAVGWFTPRFPGPISPFTSMRQIFDTTFGTPPAPPPRIAGYMGPEARLMALIGLEQGFAGAQGFHDFLWPFLGVQPYVHTVPDLANRAGWALAADAAQPTASTASEATR